MATISIIIPALNEADSIQKTIAPLVEQGAHEIIVVDGGSKDRTVEIASEAGALVLSATPHWRSSLMNEGAKNASGNYLFFLHADTIVPRNALSLIPSDAGAATYLIKWDTDHPWMRAVAWYKNNCDVWMNVVLGDHGLVVRKEIFEQMGGFANIPIMEDLEFYRRLVKKTKVHIIKEPVVTSARRFVERGIIRQWGINQIIKAGYALGVSHEKLARLYYGLRKN